MPRTRLLSTATFRLTLLFLGVFSLSAVALLVGVYLMSVRFMEQQSLETIGVEVEGLLDQYRYGRIDQLGLAIEQRARDEPDGESVYILTDRTGQRLAGDRNALLSEPPTAAGGVWHFQLQVPARGKRAPELHAAIGQVYDLDGAYFLLVGRDIEDDLRMQGLLRLAILVGGAIMIVLGLGAGYVLARWMMHRLEGVNRTTSQIMAGDLGRRIAVRGTDDEFDELGRNLNAMLERIERLLTSMRQVTDDIAHDLRTPLSRLRSRIEVALMGGNVAGETRELLEATLRDADGLIETFNALLNIARAEAGDLRSDLERFDLSEVARDIFELYEPIAEEKGIRLELQADGPVEVEAHRQLLAQALANLTDNAIKYTGVGGTVSVRAEAQPAPRLTVSDNGPGIPQAERERAKERFVRLDSTRTSPGSGLGLSLVDAVARLHDARLELEDNQPGLVARLVLRQPPPAASPAPSGRPVGALSRVSPAPS